MQAFIFPLKIYIEDTDYGGVVYNVNYLKFFERARTEWMETLGMGLAWQQEQGIYFAVRSIHIDYLKPTRLCDQLEITSTFSDLKRVSLVFHQQLHRTGATDTILCQAEVKVVCVDAEFKPQSIPQGQLHEIFMGEQA